MGEETGLEAAWNLYRAIRTYPELQEEIRLVRAVDRRYRIGTFAQYIGAKHGISSLQTIRSLTQRNTNMVMAAISYEIEYESPPSREFFLESDGLLSTVIPVSFAQTYRGIDGKKYKMVVRGDIPPVDYPEQSALLPTEDEIDVKRLPRIETTNPEQSALLPPGRPPIHFGFYENTNDNLGAPYLTIDLSSYKDRDALLQHLTHEIPVLYDMLTRERATKQKADREARESTKEEFSRKLMLITRKLRLTKGALAATADDAIVVAGLDEEEIRLFREYFSWSDVTQEWRAFYLFPILHNFFAAPPKMVSEIGKGRFSRVRKKEAFAKHLEWWARSKADNEPHSSIATTDNVSRPAVSKAIADLEKQFRVSNR